MCSESHLLGLQYFPGIIGLCLLNSKTSYHRISWNLEAARFGIPTALKLYIYTYIFCRGIQTCKASIDIQRAILFPILSTGLMKHIAFFLFV